MLAGQAFANSPVAAVHALAYPLGARHHIPHGLSNALMLIPVLQFNAPVAAPYYAELAAVIGEEVSGNMEKDAAIFIAAMVRIIAESVHRKSCAMSIYLLKRWRYWLRMPCSRLVFWITILFRSRQMMRCGYTNTRFKQNTRQKLVRRVDCRTLFCPMTSRTTEDISNPGVSIQ
ncbi:iron-containing alcohol dehydrogenase [Citrobacter sp. FDAARGOS_156]|uniref:iron-containing alcohol dehydrogenase n=1 Tax=Citrobacter sp. FDAARGOS_156 TaxID=1702170 RepID=UPI000ADBD45B|nr:iron-containing alcohol dehydrogenase [Citrobacter sp. FDAARGOS_156]